MWLCEGEDLTSISEFCQPDTPQPLGQRGVNPPVAIVDGQGSGGTDRTMTGIESSTDVVTDRNMAGKGISINQGRKKIHHISGAE